MLRIDFEAYRQVVNTYTKSKPVPCKYEFLRNAADDGAEIRVHTTVGVNPERVFYARGRITPQELGDVLRREDRPALVQLLHRAADDAYSNLCAELREFLRGA